MLAAPDHRGVPNAALAALLLYISDPYAPSWRPGRSLAATFPIVMRLQIDGKALDVEIVRGRDGGYVAAVDGHDHRLEVERVGEGNLRFKVEGVNEQVSFAREADRLFMQRGGETLTVRDLTRAAPGARRRPPTAATARFAPP